jgi:RimJ/RimL family protein N-acetyltransferase
VSRLRLEPLSVDHLDHVMRWVNDPEVTFYFAELNQQITREQERAYLERLVASDSDRTWSIFEGGEYLGQIGLAKIYWPARNARLGVNLCREAWGRGVAQEAANLVLDKAFGELGLHKVWLIVRSDNSKGLHLWTKLGFRCEGILREEYRSALGFHDMVRFALLESDRKA